jgi:hypothetical protein
MLYSCGSSHDTYRELGGEIMASKSFIYADNSNIVTIDNEKVEFIPYSELNNILKEIKYIPLISKEPVGEIFKVLIYKERIYVLDAFVAEKIFIFNMQGKIIRIINSKGGGPNEYRGLMDMTISPENDYLVISDRLAPFVLYFSLDGEFVKKTRGIFNTTVEIVDDKLLNQLNPGQSFDDNVNYHLVVTVGDSVIRKGFPFYPLQMDAIFIPPFRYNYKNELLFCPYYCDTVYQIINDSVYTAKYIVKHKNSIWKKHNERINNDDYNRLVQKSDYTVLRAPVLETEKFVYYPIEAKIKINDLYYKHSYSYWFNKKTGTSFTLENPKQGEHIYHFIPFPKSIYGNHYAGIIPLEGIELNRQNIRMTEEAGNFMYQNKELRDMIMDEKLNPEAILVLYEFNDSEE